MLNFIEDNIVALVYIAFGIFWISLAIYDDKTNNTDPGDW